MLLVKRLWLSIIFIILLVASFAWINPLDINASNSVEFEGEQNVIIGFNNGYSHQDLSFDLPIEKEFNLINAVAANLTSTQVNALHNSKAIDYIDFDESIELLGPPFGNDGDEEDASWGLNRIFNYQDPPFDVWDETSGEEMAVAVFDTGIEGSHEDLNVVGGYNTLSDDPYNIDLNGHGTHVAGIIGALYNDVGVIGVAPEVELYSVIVLNEEGSGSTSNLIEGIEWVVDNNIKIVNMSLGTTSYSSALENAINSAADLGHIFIGSSGNDGEDGGEDTMNYPAKFSNVIAVGATNEDDTLAEYSSYGPSLDIVAPGTSIRSTYLGDSYERLSGTSMAAPFVSGVVALLLSLDNTLSLDQVLTILQDSAEDLNLEEDKQGEGLLRADLAYDALHQQVSTETHTIIVDTPINGSINPSGTFEVDEGSDVTFELTSDEGYKIDAILINEEPQTINETFVIEDINQDYHIEVLFTQKTYTLSFETEGSEVDALEVLYDDAIPSLESSSLSGHSFEGWFTDETLETAFDYETMPAYDMTLYASFERNTYTVGIALLWGTLIFSRFFIFKFFV